MILGDGGMAFEEGMDGAAEVSDAFAVDDAKVKDAAFKTGIDVIQDDIFHVGRPEGVQVEGSVDGDLYGNVIRRRRFVAVVRHIPHDTTNHRFHWYPLLMQQGKRIRFHTRLITGPAKRRPDDSRSVATGKPCACPGSNRAAFHDH